MKRYAILLALALSLLLAQTAAANMELVTNGGFETVTGYPAGNEYDPGWGSNPTGWTVVDTSGNISVDVIYVYTPPEGKYQALLGPYKTLGSVSQTLDTTSGASYNLSFWLANDTAPPTGTVKHFEVQWGGNTLTGGGTLALSLDNVGVFDYAAYNFTVVAPSASTELKFISRSDNGYFYLDDVSVNAVPIPGAVVLLGSGLLGLIGWRRIRKS